MRPTQATKTKLQHSKEALAAEFEHVPPEDIARRLEEIAHWLLEAARFDDYIPVLAHRYAREELRQRPHAGALAQAA